MKAKILNMTGWDNWAVITSLNIFLQCLLLVLAWSESNSNK